MAYKFQIGEAKLSGSITQTSGSGDLQALTVDSLNASNGGISNAGAIAGVTTVSGSGQFQVGSIAIGGTAVSATAAELNVLASSGLAAADMSTLAGLALDGVSGLAQADFTKLAAVNASAADLNFLNGAETTNSNASVAVIKNASNGFTFQDEDNSGDSLVFVNPNASNNAELKLRRALADVDGVVLHAVNGISLDGSNFINSGEINVLNSVVAGTAAASKALVLDSSSDIVGINTGSFAFVSSSGDIVANGLLLGSTSGFITGVLQDDGNGQIELQLAVSGGLAESGNELEINLATNSGLERDENGLAIQLSGSQASGLIKDSAGIKVELSASGGLQVAAGGGIRIQDLGVSNGMLAGSIANSKLANSAMTIAGTSVSLGGSIAASVIAAAVDGEDMAITGLTDLDVKTAGDITILDSVGSNTLTIGAASTTVAIAGDLQVDGDLTYVNTTNLRVTDAKVVFADGASGLAAGQGFYIGSDAGDATEKASFAVGNGGGTNDAFVSSLNISASAYYGDGSNLSGVTADSAAVLFEQTASVSTTTKTLDVNNDGTFVLVDNSSNVVAITLPAAADADGMTFKIKKTTSNTVNAVTVDASGSQTIDGDSAAINLDSPYAAVNLFSDGTQWLIY